MRAFLAHGSHNQAVLASCESLLASLLYYRGQFQEAWQYVESAIAHAAELQLPKVQTESMRTRGALQWLNGDYVGAIRSCRQALRTAQQIGDSELEYACRIALGAALIYMGEYEESILQTTPCLHPAEQAVDWQHLAMAHNNLGIANNLLGRYQAALENHQRAQQIYHQYPDPARASVCCMNIAVIYSEMEQYETALAWCSQALEIMPADAHPRIEGTIRANAGEAYFWLDRIQEATASLETAEYAFRETEYTPGLAETLAFLGCCKIRNGLPESGSLTLREAVRLAEQSTRKDVHVLALYLAGYGNFLMNDKQTASTYLHQAYAMAQIAGIRRLEERIAKLLQQIP